MLKNLVTLHDIAALASAVKRAGVRATFAKLGATPTDRVKATWQQHADDARRWTDIPAIQRRINSLISGDAQKNVCEYVSERFLSGRNNLTALSLGCGTGNKEIDWHKTGRFSTIDAYDISEARITVAIDRVRQLHLDHAIRFQTHDVYTLKLPERHYDLLIFEDALHHLSPVGRILNSASTWLADDGMLVLKEFVGPNRFQWTERQLEIVNALLTIIPNRYKVRWPDGKIKSREYRPGTLSIILHDPSEAAESSVIPETVRTLFDVIDERPCGGAVLHLLLKNIAQNFIPDSPDVNAVLDMCFLIEDNLMKAGALGSDFGVFVGRKKKR